MTKSTKGWDFDGINLERKLTAAEKRTEAIAQLVSSYVGQYGDQAGHVQKAYTTFSDLQGDVGELRSLGRSKNWQRAIDEWIRTIGTAAELFAEYMDFTRHSAWNVPRHQLTQSSTEEFDKLMVWAVYQGSIHATHGNQ